MQGLAQGHGDGHPRCPGPRRAGEKLESATVLLDDDGGGGGGGGCDLGISFFFVRRPCAAPPFFFLVTIRGHVYLLLMVKHRWFSQNRLKDKNGSVGENKNK